MTKDETINQIVLDDIQRDKSSDLSMSAGSEYEKWLRETCFKEPTPEAYELAKSAWNEATNRSTKWVGIEEWHGTVD